MNDKESGGFEIRIHSKIFFPKFQVQILIGPTGLIQFPKVQKQAKIMVFLFFLTLNHMTTVITTKAPKDLRVRSITT